jgi:glc operon protein GlcG
MRNCSAYPSSLATRRAALLLGVGLLAAVSSTLHAQDNPVPQTAPDYGPSISLELAKRVMDRATRFAQKNGWAQSISIVDAAGQVKAQQTIDRTPYVSVEIARRKAYAAFVFRKPTKVHEDALARGGPALVLLSIDTAFAGEGGIPIVYNGAVVGAIGVSGGSPQQDGLVAEEGLRELNPSP